VFFDSEYCAGPNRRMRNAVDKTSNESATKWGAAMPIDLGSAGPQHHNLSGALGGLVLGIALATLLLASSGEPTRDRDGPPGVAERAAALQPRPDGQARLTEANRRRAAPSIRHDHEVPPYRH
jgi:hypothetical protein